MQVTIQQVRHTQQAIAELAQTRMPAVVAMRIGIALRAIQPVMEEFDKTHNALLTQYGTPVEGTPNQFKINDAEKFNKEVNELLEQVITINADKIPVSMFVAIEVKPATLAMLDWLIDM